MHYVKNLWDQFISKENFELALKNSQKGKKGRRPVIIFNENRDENLEKIRQMVIKGEFHK